MALTDTDLTRIARLARLDLPPERLARLRGEFSHMLALIDRLQAVDTQGVEPLAHPLSAHEDIALRLREDVVTEAGDDTTRAALLANAPATRDGLFLVPKVIE